MDDSQKFVVNEELLDGVEDGPGGPTLADLGVMRESAPLSGNGVDVPKLPEPPLMGPPMPEPLSSTPPPPAEIATDRASDEQAMETARQSLNEQTPAPGEEKMDPKRRSLARKVISRIKTGVVNYAKNLDPRGKDKVWWAGNLLSTGLSAYLTVQTGGTYLLAKSLATAGTSMGFYMGEKGIYKLREKRVNKMYTGTPELGEKIAELQARHEKGTGRIRRFLLGVSAGSVYGGVTGIATEAITNGSVNLGIPAAWKESSAGHAVSKATSRVSETSVPFTDTTIGGAVHSAGELATNAYHGAHIDNAVSEVTKQTGNLGDKVSSAYNSETVQNVVSGAHEQAGNLGQHATETYHSIIGSDASQDVQGFVSNTVDKTQHITTQASDKVQNYDYGNLVDQAKDSMRSGVDKISSYVPDNLRDAVGNTISDGTSKAGDLLSSAQNHIENVNMPDVQGITDKAADLASSAKETVAAQMPNVPTPKPTGFLSSIRNFFGRIG